MTESMVKTGAPVELINGDGLESSGLFTGDMGMINSVVEIEGIEYVYFMPKGEFKSYVINSNRVRVLDDEEAEHYGLMDVEEESISEE